jgi:hypothetical protein
MVPAVMTPPMVPTAMMPPPAMMPMTSPPNFLDGACRLRRLNDLCSFG